MTQEEGIVPSLSLGPYMSVACFAEKVLTETDQVHSLIRIIDRIRIAVTAQGEMKARPTIRQSLMLFISLKCGGERGSHHLDIVPIKPGGERLPPTSHPVHFEGPEYKGITIKAHMVIDITGEGTWWFEIRHRNRMLTKVPLDVIVHVQTPRRTPRA